MAAGPVADSKLVILARRDIDGQAEGSVVGNIRISFARKAFIVGLYRNTLFFFGTFSLDEYLSFLLFGAVKGDLFKFVCGSRNY